MATRMRPALRETPLLPVRTGPIPPSPERMRMGGVWGDDHRLMPYCEMQGINGTERARCHINGTCYFQKNDDNGQKFCKMPPMVGGIQ